MNVRRSCRLALPRPSVWYQKSEARDQSALRLRIREIAMDRPRFGYLRVLVMLKREGWKVGKKRVYRLYRLEGLQLRMKVKRRKRISLLRGRPAPATGPNQHWSMDFVHDQMLDGRAFRVLTGTRSVESRECVSGGQLSAHRQVRRQGSGRGCDRTWLAHGHQGRQRHGVHLRGTRRMGLATRCEARLALLCHVTHAGTCSRRRRSEGNGRRSWGGARR